ncbi:hypothetical protein [Streptomyces sp. ICBB 8177]|uniref:baeRF2 domain-containing protein n=1 Tax=Streptomyces sp. ICBB 8177 TaxID=563922 RepID=UPI000D6765C1|nr:hypothetical protein [Streptomyces sp. ICBB 8177]PWI44418.1 hypothetical protein CK485_10670 [Streptomyces sp. ICBB 8177]
MELGFLRPLAHPGPWASVYLDTSRAVQDAAKQAELRRRAVTEQLVEQGADARTRDAIVDRLAAEPVSGAPAGRALFAADGDVVVDVPLTEAPPVVEASWGALPHVAPLLSLHRDEPACVVAYIDHDGADIERRDEGGRRPVGRARGRRWQGRGHRSLPADRYEWHYRNRVENAWHETAELIAGEVARQWARHRPEMLVLTGDPGELSAVRERLPEPLRDITVEAGGGSRTARSNGTLDREIERAREEYAEHHLDEVLDRFGSGRGRPGEHGRFGPDSSPGDAAEGVPSVVDAARTHQVATLLMREEAPDGGRQVWIGPGNDQVGVERSDLRAMGVREPVPARADDALLRCAAATDAEVLTVPREASRPAGGIGAVLRWSA